MTPKYIQINGTMLCDTNPYLVILSNIKLLKVILYYRLSKSVISNIKLSKIKLFDTKLY